MGDITEGVEIVVVIVVLMFEGIGLIVFEVCGKVVPFKSVKKTEKRKKKFKRKTQVFS